MNPSVFLLQLRLNAFAERQESWTEAAEKELSRQQLLLKILITASLIELSKFHWN